MILYVYPDPWEYSCSPVNKRLGPGIIVVDESFKNYLQAKAIVRNFEKVTADMALRMMPAWNAQQELEHAEADAAQRALNLLEQSKYSDLAEGY